MRDERSVHFEFRNIQCLPLAEWSGSVLTDRSVKSQCPVFSPESSQ